MRVRTIHLAGVTADDDGIAESQTPAAGGAQSLTLTGTQPPAPISIDITSGGDDSSRKFTVVGTDRFGNRISEEVAGENAGTASTVKQFATVESVTVDDDTSDAVKVGWGDELYSAWFPLNTYADDVDTTIAVKVDGTVDYDLEYTFENLQRQRDDKFTDKPYGDFEMAVDAWTDGDIDAETDDAIKVMNVRATAIRFKLNTGSTGSITARIVEAGNR